jgi:PKD repeat protein
MLNMTGLSKMYKALPFASIAVALLLAGCTGSGPMLLGPDNPDPILSTSKAGGKQSKPVSVPGATPLEGSAPCLVHFYDDGSYDPDGEIVKWEWNFSGDDESPIGGHGWEDFTDTQGDTWHTYSNNGTKIAHLRVTDNHGNKDVAMIKIKLRSDLNAAPVAELEADPMLGMAPLLVNFDASASYDPDGTVVSYAWDFDGDGSNEEVGSSPQTSYSFNVAGTFIVSVEVTDNDGAKSSAGVAIEVSEGSLEDICYAALENGSWGIWVMSSNGTGARKVCSTSFPGGRVAWSPDGSLIAFSNPEAGTGYQLWVVDVDTGIRQRITYLVDSQATWPWWQDEDTLIFQRQGGSYNAEYEIASINLDGSNLHNLTTRGDNRSDGNPVISPDGTKIAFKRGTPSFAASDKLVVADFPSFANATVIADVDGNARYDLPTDWNEISGIAFFAGSNSGHFVYRVAPDGSGLQRLSSPGNHNHTSASWSPEGQRFVFTNEDFGFHQLWTMDNDGGNPVRLDSNEAALFADWR